MHGFPARAFLALLVLGSSFRAEVARGQTPDWIVPATPPAGIPDSLIASVTGGSSRPIGRFALIAFRGDATRAQKDSTLQFLGGELIGGIPFERDGLDGWYVVRAAGDSTDSGPSFQADPWDLPTHLPWVYLADIWSELATAALRDFRLGPDDPVGDVIRVVVDGSTVWGGTGQEYRRGFRWRTYLRVVEVDPGTAGQSDRRWTFVRASPHSGPWLELSASPAGVLRSVHTSSRRYLPHVYIGGETPAAWFDPSFGVAPFLFGPEPGAGPASGRQPFVVTQRQLDDSSRVDVDRWILDPVAPAGATDGHGEFRDSAVIRVFSTELHEPGPSEAYESDLSGFVSGSSAVDSIGLIHSRSDTVQLSGTVRSRYGDGPASEVPIIHWQTRTFHRGSAAEHLLYRRERWEFGEPGERDYYNVPRPLEFRLAEGDPEAARSLLSLWMEEADGRERARTSDALRRYWPPDAEPGLAELYWAAGDTARWLGQIYVAGMPDTLPEVSPDDLTRMVPYLTDRERLLALGLAPEVLDRLSRAIALEPPALASSDTAGRRVVADALARSDGQRVPRTGAPRTLPSADAPTSAWWSLVGRGPESAGRVLSWGALPDLAAALEASPERDLGAEALARLATAETPDDTVTFRSLAYRMGALPLPSPDSMVMVIARGDSAADLAVPITLALDAAPTPSREPLVELVDAVLAAMSDPEGSPIPSLSPAGVPFRGYSPAEIHVLRPSVPADAREPLGATRSLVTMAEWDALDPTRDRTLITVQEVRRIGALARVRFAHTDRRATAPGMRMTGVDGWTTVYLGRLDGEWRSIRAGRGIMLQDTAPG